MKRVKKSLGLKKRKLPKNPKPPKENLAKKAKYLKASKENLAKNNTQNTNKQADKQ